MTRFLGGIAERIQYRVRWRQAAFSRRLIVRLLRERPGRHCRCRRFFRICYGSTFSECMPVFQLSKVEGAMPLLLATTLAADGGSDHAAVPATAIVPATTVLI